MANSVMQFVSDGNLNTIPLTIKFFEQSHISVFVNDVPLPSGGYTYVWADPTTITIAPNVAAGATVAIRRNTPTGEVLHTFQAGAVFSEAAMDENFLQDLFLLQEASEQSVVTDLYNGLNMHGTKVTNLADGTEDSDAVTLRQVQFLADGGMAAAAVAAHEAKADAHPITGVAGLQGSLDSLQGGLGGLTADLVATNTNLTAVTERVAVLEGEVRSTCLVRTTGTGAPHETVVAGIPATLAASTRLVLTNPFGAGVPVSVEVEAFLNNRWGKTGYIFTTMGLGIYGDYSQTEGIIVQSGVYTASNSATTGGVHNFTGGNITTPLPVRVFVSKLGA